MRKMAVLILVHHLRVCKQSIHLPFTQLLLNIEGDELTCWSGGYVKDSVVILVCFALNGYHSVMKYKWLHDKRSLVNGYPVLYTKESGEYECILNGAGAQKSQKFLVYGMSILLYSGSVLDACSGPIQNNV